jgi:spore germination protein GerM
MSWVDRQDILKKVMFSLWGMLTMVLLFCVILLVNEMMQRGQDPLAAVRPESVQAPAASQPGDEDAPVEMQDVVLYFASQDGHSLAPEIRSLEKSNSTVENCRNALELLIQGPRDILLPVLPPNTGINAMYLLDDGELVVDFSRELQMEQSRFRSANSEALFVFAVVSSLTQKSLQVAGQPAVTRVRFLLEGTRPQETFPAHFDLSEALRPDPAWLEPVQDRVAHGT